MADILLKKRYSDKDSEPVFVTRFEEDEPAGKSSETPWWHIAIPAAVLAVGFAAAERILYWFATPGNVIFEQPVILWGLLVERFTSVAGWIVFAAVLFVLVITKSYRLKWTDFESGRAFRAFALVLAAVLAWKFSTYGFNLYYGRWHTLDRVALILLLPLIWWRPVALVPFLVVVVAVQRQFYYPVDGYSWAVESLPLQALLLLVVAAVLQAFIRRPMRIPLMIVLLSLFAANYWSSGWAKFEMDWYSFDRVHFLLPAAYVNGWFPWTNGTAVASAAQAMAEFDGPIRWTTFLFECGAILVLSARRVAVAFAMGWILFHLGIFAASGIFFWTWMVADAALIFLLVRNAGWVTLGVFRPATLAMSVVLIASSAIWLNPITLRWFDSRLTYKYKFEAVGPSGTPYELPPDFFSPNDYAFRLSGFGYLSPPSQPVLPVTFGATGRREIADGLRRIESPDEARRLEVELGESRYNRAKAQRLTQYLSAVGSQSNAHPGAPKWLGYLTAPPSVWVFPKGRTYQDQEPITSIRVSQIASLYLGGEIHQLRKVEVAEADVSQSP